MGGIEASTASLYVYRHALTNASISAPTKAGVSFGSALAITISWSVHHPLLWAIVHGFFSWFYVIYYALTR